MQQRQHRAHARGDGDGLEQRLGGAGHARNQIAVDGIADGVGDGQPRQQRHDRVDDDGGLIAHVEEADAEHRDDGRQRAGEQRVERGGDAVLGKQQAEQAREQAADQRDGEIKPAAVEQQRKKRGGKPVGQQSIESDPAVTAREIALTRETTERLVVRDLVRTTSLWGTPSSSTKE